jgi:hypothetical protein
MILPPMILQKIVLQNNEGQNDEEGDMCPIRVFIVLPFMILLEILSAES